jgi:hypothetical protein
VHLLFAAYYHRIEPAHLVARATLDAFVLVYAVRLPALAGYGLCRASPQAQATAGAFVSQDIVCHQRPAHSCRTTLLVDVRLVFVQKVLQGGQDGIGSGLAQGAEGTRLD